MKRHKVVDVTKSICVAAGVFILASAVAGQSVKKSLKTGEMLPVLSTEGAKCTIKRTGKMIAEFVVSGDVGEHAVRFIPIDTTSHADIVVTCSKEGYEDQSKTLSIVKGSSIADSAPCALPQGSTQEEYQIYCGDHKSATTGVVMEYPKVELILRRTAAK